MKSKRREKRCEYISVSIILKGNLRKTAGRWQRKMRAKNLKQFKLERASSPWYSNSGDTPPLWVSNEVGLLRARP
tara:strand:- start:5076 stop:5300 length:225 start_codon:yes stop_codon:yes gene_type:complete